MNKTFRILMMLFAIGVLLAGCDTPAPTASQIATQKSDLTALKAVQSTPIPTVSYFQERRTISKWTERWDQPNLPTYVYLISYGNIIGYYVADGKPASTRSYLVPEETMQRYDVGSSSYNYQLTQAPDIDGTYGDNNPGIRFFTAEGTAVEWAGSGASYLYSDAPLPINVPKLNVVVAQKN